MSRALLPKSPHALSDFPWVLFISQTDLQDILGGSVKVKKVNIKKIHDGKNTIKQTIKWKLLYLRHLIVSPSSPRDVNHAYIFELYMFTVSWQ